MLFSAHSRILSFVRFPIILSTQRPLHLAILLSMLPSMPRFIRFFFTHSLFSRLFALNISYSLTYTFPSLSSHIPFQSPKSCHRSSSRFVGDLSQRHGALVAHSHVIVLPDRAYTKVSCPDHKLHHLGIAGRALLLMENYSNLNALPTSRGLEMFVASVPSYIVQRTNIPMSLLGMTHPAACAPPYHSCHQTASHCQPQLR